MQEFVRRAQEAQPHLIVASGLCDVYTGIGDPYLPFRDVMSMLTGDVETRRAAGAISRDHAVRLWHLLPDTVRLLVDCGPDLIDTFVAGGPLAERAGTYAGSRVDWLKRLQELISRRALPSGWQAADRTRLFEEFTDVLTTLAKQQPLLLILDDLHWADLSSIGLLSHLGRRITTHSMLIVGAYRPEDVALGRDGERHPLEDILSEFKRQFGNVWVSLDRSEPTEDRAFIDAILDTELNRLGEDFRRELARRTGGHPLFTIEMLQDMRARDDLWQDEEGRWIARPDLKWEALPARIEGVIEKRISRLDAELREVLMVASVVGEEFIAEVIAQVGGVDERELVRCLSGELDKQHRLVQEQGIQRVGSRRLSRYRFRHSLFQKYLYHSLGEAERAYLHEDMGYGLEALYGDQVKESAAVALQLARHFQVAGQRLKAIHYLRQVGDAAARAYANDEAITHYRQALELAKKVEMSTPAEGGIDEELPRLYTRLGRSFELNSQFKQALANYKDMEILAHEHRNQPMELAALVHQGRIRCTTNPEFNPEQGEVVSERGLALAQALGDQAAEAEIRWNMLNLYRWSNRTEQAIASGEDALALIRSLDPPTGAEPMLRQQLAYVLNDLTHCYASLGNLEHAKATSLEASHLWRKLNNKPMLADCLATASYIHTYAGKYDQAIAFSEKAWQISESIGNVWGQSYSRVQVGNAYWERGQLGQAITMMEESIRLSELSGFFVPQVMTRADLATVYGDLGAFDHGFETARLALTGAETKLPALRICVLAAVAHLQLWQGNLAEAEAAIDRGKNDPHRKTMSSFVVRIILAEGELALWQGDYERAMTAVDTLLTSLPQFEADIPKALYLQSQALLGLGQDEAARECLLEARTKAESIGSQRMLWQILAMLATIETDPAEAKRLRQQARNIVEYIADQIPTSELRTSFLNLPHVRPVLDEPIH
jgi:tetratricopeptide (TPR) repeat protein